MNLKFEPWMSGTPPWKCFDCKKRFRKKVIGEHHKCGGKK